MKDKTFQVWINKRTGVQLITTLACSLIGFHKLNRVGLSALEVFFFILSVFSFFPFFFLKEKISGKAFGICTKLVLKCLPSMARDEFAFKYCLA